MNFLPFPEPLRSAYAERTRATYESEVAERRRLGAKGPYTPGVGSVKVTRGALVFKTAHGRLIPAYDPYAASFPDDAIPGTGTVTARFNWYPNETGGYTYNVTEFEPIQ